MKKKKAKGKKPAKKSKARKPSKAKASKVRVKAKKPAKKPAKAKAKAAKKSAAKPKKQAEAPQPTVIAPPNSRLLGRVEDYFAQVGVIAFTLESPVAIGQRIQVLGHTTHLEQTVDSMQIDHEPVSQAAAGDGVGIKVRDRARAGDYVFVLL